MSGKAGIHDEDAIPDPITHHDEDTLFKVRAILGQYICGAQAVTNCIQDLQNTGIYFRERIPSWKEIPSEETQNGSFSEK